MTFAEAFLPELQQEAGSTRRLLQLVPHARADWKPHAKSATLAELSMHVATILQWVPLILERTVFDVDPPGGPRFSQPQYESPQALLALFDGHVRAAREALSKLPDAEMSVPWTLQVKGARILSMPRNACMRSFVMSHLIHHRGQLSVYLRLCDVPLPSVYGPTADTSK